MDTFATIVQWILGVLFIMSGGLKVAGIKMQVDNFNRYGYPQWFRVFTGVVEVAGAAALILGLFTSDAVTIAGAVVIGVTMVGAAYTDLRKSAPVMVVAPIVLLGLSVAVVAIRA